MLADQGLLNEEDIDPELIEQPVADVTDSSCDVELPSSQPLAEATTPETTSAGIATNSTPPALLPDPASAADTEAALLCQPPVDPASAADIARVSTEDALLCQPSVDTVSAADIVTEATPPLFSVSPQCPQMPQFSGRPQSSLSHSP